MASDDTMTSHFHSSLQDEEFDNDIEDGYKHQHIHHHNLSRLSVCSSSTMFGVDDDKDDDVDEAMAMYMSGLSIENYDDNDGDADAEFSDDKEILSEGWLSSDSENNFSSRCYHLPARGRNGMKDYGSESEGQKGVFMENKKKENDPWRERCRRMRKDTTTKVWEKNRRRKSQKKDDQSGLKDDRRSMCCMMELEEVKGCREVGFELDIPSPLSLSLSNSTLNTSSPPTSPIPLWPIAAPGDDPRDVKARLKMWAQAVAASASKHAT